MVRFTSTRQELRLITRIVERAKEKGWVAGPAAVTHWYLPSTAAMDLDAANSNGCPMDFERMLDGEDFDFLHDIAGIARHMDRNTGQLGGGFLPRFAKAEAVRRC